MELRWSDILLAFPSAWGVPNFSRRYAKPKLFILCYLNGLDFGSQTEAGKNFRLWAGTFYARE
jgi:hypothetical protein